MENNFKQLYKKIKYDLISIYESNIKKLLDSENFI